MKLEFSAEEIEFQQEVREFFQAYEGMDGYFAQGHKWQIVRDMFSAMGERNWLALGWPKEYGGLEKGPTHEYILWNEAAYARAARTPLASGIVAKSIIRYGNDAQKSKWLPLIRSGELHFSLAYSEPEAGSDLSNLRVRADLDGDHYVVTGQKCWQSYAQDMDYFWLLARTGDQESRGRGLSLFIVDKATPGITVSPLPTLDGDQLNEVHFDSVRIPKDQLVGPENGAWSMMGEALADERHIQFPPARIRRDLEEMVDWLNKENLGDDPVVRHQMAKLAVHTMEAEMHGLKVLDAMNKGSAGVVEAAMNKVVHTLACQNIARTVLDIGGPEALVNGYRPELIWRQCITETIGGGTTEIMRSVVAKQGLGLSARN